MLVAFRTLLETSDDNKHPFAVEMAGCLAGKDGIGRGCVSTRACGCSVADTAQCGERSNDSECESVAAKHGLYPRTRTRIRARTILLWPRLVHVRWQRLRNC